MRIYCAKNLNCVQELLGGNEFYDGIIVILRLCDIDTANNIKAAIKVLIDINSRK
jgi:hypothetical protein